MWLANLVENLLSVSRIENGTIRLKMEPELLEEVFQEALTHLDRKAKEHTITVELPDDMLMAKMDARLIVQVVINIVNNAIKYTPPGSHVQVSARKRGESVEVRIADDGPGISDEAKAQAVRHVLHSQQRPGRRAAGPVPVPLHCAGPRRLHHRGGQLSQGRYLQLYTTTCGGEHR